MLRVVAALAAVLGVLCFATASWGRQQRVAVLQPDAELFRAITLALTPWGLQTVQSDVPLPGASQPETARTASRLTRDLEVESLVWLTKFDRGSLLWVYDAGTGDVTTRGLAESPPFDSASAAAVALTVKTVLRASAVAPPGERLGSQPAPPKRDPLWAVEIGGSGHWLAPKDVAFMGDLAGIVWLPAARRVGFSLELSYGPGLRVKDTAYDGYYRDFVAGAKLRFRAIQTPAFWSLVALGSAAHWSMLHGSLSTNTRQAYTHRLNGSINLETSANFKVSDNVYLGASIGGAYFLRYQRYLVEGEAVFSLRPWAVNLAGYCGFEIF